MLGVVTTGRHLVAVTLGIWLTACSGCAGNSPSLETGVRTSPAANDTNSRFNPRSPLSPSSPLAPRSESAVTSRGRLLPAEPPPVGAAQEFTTDFTRHTVSYREILSGGPPKDGIPALDEPRFVSVPSAGAWLRPQEPVVLIRSGGDAAIYPIQILMFHELVNDTVGEIPLTISFCPLCNTAIAFVRRVEGKLLDFGTTGRLRNSNLIMYDRQTESWWQQGSGRGIAGEYAGRQLDFFPASMVAWSEARDGYPQARVLSRETGHQRPYGHNPYVGYDDINQSPFLYRGPPTPKALPPAARVLALEINGESVAYPYSTLRRTGVINDTVGGVDVVVLWSPGAASALDAPTIADGRAVGSAVAYHRKLGNRVLEFRRAPETRNLRFFDDQTSSRWDVLGRARSGELRGRQLSQIRAFNHLWFSWAAFKPKTRVFGQEPQKR